MGSPVLLLTAHRLKGRVVVVLSPCLRLCYDFRTSSKQYVRGHGDVHYDVRQLNSQLVAQESSP